MVVKNTVEGVKCIYCNGVFCPCCGMAFIGSLPPYLGSFVFSLLCCMSSVNVKITVNR